MNEATVDPVGEAAAAAVGEVIAGKAIGQAAVLDPDGDAPEIGASGAIGPGPGGSALSITLRLTGPAADLHADGGSDALRELVAVLPRAGVRAAAALRPADPEASGGPETRRALRDMVAANVLEEMLTTRLDTPPRPGLVAEIIDHLVETGGTLVEAQAPTHGVVVSDHFEDRPRLEVPYPDDVRPAKRAPLLFDGQRSVLIVDGQGRARTEAQLHRLDRLSPDARPLDDRAHRSLDGGLLVGEVNRLIGGVGLYLRADRSIWAFADGRPVLVRQAEHWTAFPLQLGHALAEITGTADVASLLARTALLISTQPKGAILAVVGDPDALDDYVPSKDRYDRRAEVDPTGMRPETRLHHLIDAEQMDEQTLARLAGLDGATVLDRDGRLLAYGAVVTSADSVHEGARTAAARTLSEVADLAIKVSMDGDITVFRDGAVVVTVLGASPHG